MNMNLINYTNMKNENLLLSYLIMFVGMVWYLISNILTFLAEYPINLESSDLILLLKTALWSTVSGIVFLTIGMVIWIKEDFFNEKLY